MKLSLVLVILCGISTIKSQEVVTGDDPTVLPTTDVFSRTTSVTTSQCDAESQCQCTVEAPSPCAYDVEYAELVQARQRLEVVYSLVQGEVVESVKTTLNGLLARMTTLEASLHNQSISLSMTELAGLQDQVSSIQGTLAQLALTVNSTVTQQLAAEVELIRSSLLELGTKNPIAVKEDLEAELSALRSRVQACSTITAAHQEEGLDFIGDGLPANQTITDAHCPAYQNISVGSPVTYKFRNIPGMWMKDPLPTSEEAKTKIYEVRHSYTTNQYLYSYNNLDDYESSNFLSKATQSTGCAFHIYGQKVVYVEGKFYWYDEYSSAKNVKKYNDIWSSTGCRSVTSPNRYTNIQYDYNGHNYNDGDINFDETGLYVVYADVNGDMEIALLNRDTLEHERIWKTGKQKSSIANVFMVCGRLYTIDDYRSRHLSGAQWGYDTDTEQEFVFNLDVESKFGNIQSLSYNPREKALFGWDNGHAVLYPVYF